MTAGKAVPNDLVLRHEAGKRRDAAERERRGEKGPERDWQALAQTTHQPHVLYAAHRMDHGTRTEEEAGFEKRMRHQVENAVHVSAHANRGEHVTELAN